MKVSESSAALRNPWREGAADDCEPVHALLPSEARPLRPLEIDPKFVRSRPHLNERASQRGPTVFEDRRDAPFAACGVRVHTVFPLSFDTEEPDACPECLQWAELLQTDPAEYNSRMLSQKLNRLLGPDWKYDLEAFNDRQARDLG